MPPRLPRLASVTEHLTATPDQLWAIVSDPTRIGEWSGECHTGEWLGGSSAMVPGARFVGRNRTRWIRWERPCVVVDSAPPGRLVYDTSSRTDSTRWTVILEPGPGGSGTLATLGYETLRMWRAIEWIVSTVMPEHHDRTDVLRADLHRLDAAARGEADPGGAAPA